MTTIGNLYIYNKKTMLKNVTAVIIMLLSFITSNAQIPAYLNADAVKQKLSSPPLNYHFISNTSSYVAKNGANTVTISFNPATKQISTISCSLDVTSMHPSLTDAKCIFDFFEAFDSKAAAYFSGKYKGMIENKKVFDDTDPYIDKSRKLKYSFDHSLFDAREAKKNNPSYTPSKGTMYMVAEVNRL